MAETPIAQNPFLYHPRWHEIENLDPFNRQLLEERDRELEDYLGTLSGGAVGTTSAIALRRVTDQASGAIITEFVANCNTTDYIVGAGASVGSLSGSAVIQIDVAGVWHADTSGKWYNSTANNSVVYLGIRRSGVMADAVGGADHTTSIAFRRFSISADFNLQVGDLIYCCIYPGSIIGGPVGGVNVTYSQDDPNSPAARLSAHLVSAS